MSILANPQTQVNTPTTTCDCYLPGSLLCPDAKRLWEKVLKVSSAFDRGEATQDQLDAARNAFVWHMGGR